jgi:catechol 2,3-dioxygenase-like lactoylglutathione lyase family enzyme
MLQHVALPVPRTRIDACVAFYELLGFALRPVPPGIEGRAVWLERGATQIHLLFHDDPAERWPGHIAVVLDDYEDVVARLHAAGRAPEARRAHWGSPRAYVDDPAGQRVEIMAFPPAPAGPTAD